VPICKRPYRKLPPEIRSIVSHVDAIVKGGHRQIAVAIRGGRECASRGTDPRSIPAKRSRNRLIPLLRLPRRALPLTKVRLRRRIRKPEPIPIGPYADADMKSNLRN